MTDKEIFFRSIIKAHKNKPCLVQEGVADFSEDDDFQYFYKAIIFSHDFAKAYFGEQTTSHVMGYDISKGDIYDHSIFQPTFEYTIELPEWQFHLQQMVLEEEPLKYLEKFLD